MSQLIIAIIGIALLTAISGASMYYGGEAFQKGKIDAEATRYRSEAQQIANAIILYKADGNDITSEFELDDLVTENYMAKLPQGWGPGTSRIINTLEEADPSSEHICMRALQQSGYTFNPADPQVEAYSRDATMGIPHCSNPEIELYTPCCVNPA